MHRYVKAIIILLASAAATAVQAQTPSMLDPVTTQVAGGGAHTCALTTEGGVKCWGYNGYGQLGNPTNSGTINPNPTPADVSGLTSGAAAIAAGVAHTCALTTAGGVKCWGLNNYGQLGSPTNNGTTTANPTPTNVSGLTSGVAAIAAGSYQTCALTTAGGIKCWGDNSAGELGNPVNSGTSNPNPTPTGVTGLASGVTAIAAGALHTCALTTAGGVKCWGDNSAGELGNSTNSGPTPTDVTGLTSGVAAIAAGYYHTCALTPAGGVKCWGRNDYGQLGNPTNNGALNPNPTPADVSGLTSGVSAIAAGDNHTCALTTAGGVKCWGYNSDGELGNPTNNGTNNPNPAPANVGGLTSGVTAIAGGGAHTCALTTAGGVKCWGLNNSGQLGDSTNNGTNNPNPTPTAVTNLTSGVAAIAAGVAHTCALTTSGGVRCWGENSYGQLGNPTNSGTNYSGTGALNPAPLDVMDAFGIPISGVAAIAGGSAHTCALTTAGGVKCWGSNEYGQLGNPTNSGAGSWDPYYTPNPTPTNITNLTSGVAAIAAGNEHTCALTTAGGVKCWGRNDYGQLGNGTTNKGSDTPVSVTGLASGVAAIAAGGYHTCAVTTVGGVLCWGFNYHGQLGNSTNDNTANPNPTPAAVSGLTGVAAITARGDHTCALTSVGGVLCWGWNGEGQLGNPTNSGTTPSINPTPTAVTGLPSGVAAIAAGVLHTCALTTAGEVKCWGYNYYGQLGNTTNNALENPNPTPIDVAGLTGVAAIALNGWHTCALTTAGGVQCWGDNSSGQLGKGVKIGAINPNPTPVDTGLTGGAKITAGGDHTCALTTAGGVQCWGDNYWGQLGNSTNNHSTSPNPTPTAVTNLANGVAAIAAGFSHTCALTTAGGVKCWGYNDYGQLGNPTNSGANTPNPTPTNVTNLANGVAAIAAGFDHTCALTTAGGVKCWGNNSYGQLGNPTNNGTTNANPTPTDVTGLTSGVAAIAAGFSHTCALTTAGGVKCWGTNIYGELGKSTNSGTINANPTPTTVAGLTGVAAIASSGYYTCALTTAGGVKCWGINIYGELGNSTNNGTNNPNPTPVDVAGLTGVAAIAAGANHTCALTTAGVVQCWGANTYGQLGNSTNNGTGNPSPAPTAVAGLTGVAAIAVGYWHTCALTTTGGARCWGDGYFGQLGSGTNSSAYFGSPLPNPAPMNLLAGQSIAFAPSQRMVLDDSVTLYATASSSLPVSFDVWTPGNCTLNGDVLTLTDIGLCGVRASQAGGADAIGGTIAPAPQQLRLIQVESNLLFANGFD